MWHRLERKKVTIEEIPDNKLYSLDNSSLYIKKADKKLYIYRRLRADKLLDHYELISVEKNLFAIEPLMQSAIIIDEDCDLDFKANFFYVLLQYANQQVCIKELLSQRIVLKVNDEKDCKIVGKRNLYRWDGKTRFESQDVEDIIIRLWNADCKNIAFYSIRKGYIFGPYNYSKIDNY